MSAVPQYLFDEPTGIGALLDDLLRHRRCRPAQARALCRKEELPWVLGGYVHPADDRSAWRAWTQAGRTSLVLARLAEVESGAHAGPVLSVSFFDCEGQPFPIHLWRRLPDGNWLECESSPGTGTASAAAGPHRCPPARVEGLS